MNTNRILWNTVLLLGLAFASQFANAQGAGDQKDVFKGKLFAPNIILEHQGELDLTKEQYTAIKAAVVEVQSNVAGHEWDLRQAYVQVLANLDESPIDEKKVLKSVRLALQAENNVKQLQVAMLIKLRNLLTDDQAAYLRSVRAQ